MPAAPRPQGKAKKIAYALLGVPENIKNQKPAFGKEISRKLNYQSTMRVR